MRKTSLFALLFFIMLLSSCSQDELTEINDANEKPSTNLKHAGDGKHDLLGFSYDITKEYLHVDAASRSVIDIDAFRRDNETRYYNPSSTLGYSDTYSGATSMDMLEEIKTKQKVNIGGNYGLFSGSIKVESEMDRKYTFSSKYSYARADVIKRVRRLYLNADINMLMKYLNPSFNEDLIRLSPEKFVAEYGTHVLTDITIGGRLSFLYRSAIVEESDYTRKKDIVEAGAKFSIGKFGADAKNSHENETIKSLNKKNATWKTWINYHGGEESGESLTYDSEKGYPTTTFNKSAWEKSVTTANAALVEINWDKTYPIYEFITDPIKKAQIKAAVDKYITDSKVDILDIVPFFHLFHEKDMNDNFQTKWSDVENMKKAGFKYLGIMGYIYPDN